MAALGFKEEDRPFKARKIRGTSQLEQAVQVSSHQLSGGGTAPDRHSLSKGTYQTDFAFTQTADPFLPIIRLRLAPKPPDDVIAMKGDETGFLVECIQKDRDTLSPQRSWGFSG